MYFHCCDNVKERLKCCMIIPDVCVSVRVCVCMCMYVCARAYACIKSNIGVNNIENLNFWTLHCIITLHKYTQHVPHHQSTGQGHLSDYKTDGKTVHPVTDADDP